MLSLVIVKLSGHRFHRSDKTQIMHPENKNKNIHKTKFVPGFVSGGSNQRQISSFKQTGNQQKHYKRDPHRPTGSLRSCTLLPPCAVPSVSVAQQNHLTLTLICPLDVSQRDSRRPTQGLSGLPVERKTAQSPMANFSPRPLRISRCRHRVLIRLWPLEAHFQRFWCGRKAAIPTVCSSSSSSSSS